MVCALAYEQCRPGLVPQRNAPIAEGADAARVAGPIKGMVTATELLDAFRKDEKKAVAEYAGHAYLIRGLVGAGSEPSLSGTGRNVPPAPPYALLLSEADISPAERELTPYIRRSSWAAGVYCKFNQPFSLYARPKDSEYGRRIKELLVKCTVEGFSTQAVSGNPHEVRPAVTGNPDEVKAAEGRVVASDCSVVDYFLYDR